MVLGRVVGLLGRRSTLRVSHRSATTTATGEVLPMPHIIRFGLVGVVCAVIPGLLIGATISKRMANFLEENELFVPSDDDDEDD
ncbi:hypothetical protein GE061_002779 [Apolygus lucorum]|uniref:Essential MCU regulator, mitochondrial n=1 Tax=Apolygus lucorum TaxID=248454 RepID=A0A6A4JWB7_APOLU|nr:hypothetical protein GE061_002779 [Apolygus lucorum]